MRWVVLTDDAPPQLGGVATWTRWAVDALGAVAYARDRPGLDPRFRPVSGRHFGRWGGLHLARKAWWDLRAADAVLATTWPVAMGAMAVLPRSTPLHVVFHGSDLLSARRRRRRGALGLLARRATFWAVSHDLAARARRLGLDVEVLPVPIVSRDDAPCEGTRWMCVARAIPSKGGERFIRIAAHAGHPADLVGDGPELGRWRSLVDRLDAPVAVHGALDRSALEPLWHRAGLVFLLSRAQPDGAGEGLGLTLLEASARGIPTVGSGTGGIPEAAGLVLPRPDDPAHSVGCIHDWLTPRRGAEAQAWLEAQHGVEAFQHALCARS